MKLWDTTIEGHRRVVHESILDAAGKLMATEGVTAITMSRIAELAGIGRATLYKYFNEVDAILEAWHERHVETHLKRISDIRNGPGRAVERLATVLEVFALISREQHAPELLALLHRGRHVAKAHQDLVGVVRDLIAEGASAGELRAEVPPRELAHYCLHAMTAASATQSRKAIRRLVEITLSGLGTVHGRAIGHGHV